MKRWIDMVEEDMKRRGVVQQDTRDRKGWIRRAVKGLANPVSREISRDNMMMITSATS